MIKRSFDPALMQSAMAMCSDTYNEDFNYEGWVANKNHIMLVEDNNVGLLTHEYPGLYTAHWFFHVRGRDAIKLAQRMLYEGFKTYGVKAIRGLTRADLKAARWAVRQVGCKSYGMLTMENGEDYELFCTTAEEFYDHLKTKGIEL
jgi:hypothetical protein